MSKELIDAVAKAMWDCTPTHCDATWDEAIRLGEDTDCWDGTVKDFRKMATAAIGAVRQHTGWVPITKDTKAPGRVLLAGWEGDWNQPKRDQFITLGYVVDGRGTDYGNHRIEEGGAWEATHYMPLPAPPTKD